MLHFINFSGGKDSTALLCWAKENLEEWTALFCDTGWEHQETYDYIEHINQTFLGGELVTLRSAKYAGFADLAISRKMVPGVRSRFCTQELKLFPLFAYYEQQDDEVTSYVGIRQDESRARSLIQKDTIWNDDGGGYWTKYPLLRWTAEDCFNLIKKHGLAPNPLYLRGAGRVGCYPCIMTSHKEMRAFIKTDKEGLRARIQDLENKLNEDAPKDSPRTFFRSNFIPARFCTSSAVTKDGRTVPIPTINDVIDYLEGQTDENQGELFDAPACFSIYNLCE